MKNLYNFFKLLNLVQVIKILVILFVSLVSANAFGQSPYIDNTPGGVTSFTVPAGVTSITVEIWGAGGAGGGSTSDTQGGSGGGSGGYSSRVFAVTGGEVISYSTGTGGTGGAGTGGTGTLSTLTFGGFTLTANGGSGGAKNKGAFGVGGTATGGTINTTGINGAIGTATGNEGGGAPAGGGTGGAGGVKNNNGNPGNIPGGGGGGGEYFNYFFGTLGLGGNGGDGGIKVTFICSTIPITTTESFNLSTTLPSCWNKQIVTGADYLSVVGTDVDPFTTPVTTTPFEGSNMVKYNSFAAPSGNSERLVTTPLSSLGITDGVDVEFYWSSNNTYKVGSPNPTDKVQIQYSTDAITWSNAGSTIPRFLTYDNQNWIKQTVNIPTAVNNISIFYIGFLFISDNSLSMYMDKVTIKPTPKVILVTPSSPIICAGSSSILTASSSVPYSYTWSPSIGLSSTTGATVTANPASTTTYTVTGVNGQMTTAQTVTVSVNSAPTLISATPVNNNTCDDTTDYVTIASSGGVLTNTTLLTEDFNGAMTGWIFNNSSTGGTPANAKWTQRNNEYVWRTTTISSNDKSAFIMSNSDSQNGGTTTTSAESPSISTIGLTSLNLSFYQYFRQVYATDITKVQYSVNGGVWSDITQLTNSTTQGSAKNFLQTSFTLNSGNYPSILDNKDVKLRFFYSSPNGWYWAVDNVVVTGTGKRVIWSPATGLYTNTSLSTPYTLGDNGVTVYAAPDGAQVYTPSSSVGICTNTSNTVSISFNNKKFSVASGNWSVPGNWFPSGIPDNTRCVKVPNAKIAAVDIIGALAKTITVDAGGQFTIKKDYALTVTDGIINNGGAANFVVESDANLKQITENITNAGNVIVKRESPMQKNNYTYWSSPVSGQNLHSFSSGTAPTRFYEYHEFDDMFYNPAETAFIPGKGYAIMAPSAYTSLQTFTGNFIGVPNNGTNATLQFPLQLSTGGDKGYNMIGNPYPSNIDFDKLFTINGGSTIDPLLGNIHHLAYFWTNVNPNRAGSTNGTGSNYSGSAYAIYNGTGGIPATSETNTPVGYTPTSIIKVGQGFIVKAKKVDNLIFNNTIRTTVDTHFFSKGSASEKDRYWLKLTTPALDVNTILIGYVSGATNNFEWDYDAPLLSVGSDSFYSLLNEDKLGIQGRTYPLNTQDIVTLGTKHFDGGNYTISLGDREGIFADTQKIYLKDKQTGIITNLSEGSYTFAANIGESRTRFEIIYKPETVLATDTSAKANVQLYKDQLDFVVASTLKKIFNIELYDLSGRLMFNQKANAKVVRFNAEKLVDGVYMVRAELEGGEIFTKKMKK